MAKGPVIVARIIADNELSKEIEALGIQIVRLSETALKSSQAIHGSLEIAAQGATTSFKEMATESVQAFRLVNAAAREAGAGVRSAGRDAAGFAERLTVAEKAAKGLHGSLKGLASMAPLLGPAVLAGLGEGVHKTLSYDTTLAAMQASGISSAEIETAKAHARAVSTGQFKAVSQQEVLQDYLEARSATATEVTDPKTGAVTKTIASPDDLKKITEVLAQARQAMRTTGLNPEDVGLYVKSAESLNINTPEALRTYIDNQLKSIQVLGKTINPEDQRTAIQNAGLAASTLDADFRDKYLQSYIQEVGAQKAGSGLGAVFRTVVGEKMTKASAKEFQKYGLIQGPIKSGGGNSVILEHGVEGEDEFQKNPAEWAWKLKQRLIAAGLTTFSQREKEYFKMFGKIGAQDFIGKFDQQEETIKKHGELFDKGMGLNAATITNPEVQLEESRVQAENLAIEALKPAVADLGSAADGAAGALGRLTNTANSLSAGSPGLYHAASDVGLLATGGLGAYASASLLTGIGGKGPLGAILKKVFPQLFKAPKASALAGASEAQAAEVAAATAEVAGGAAAGGEAAAGAGGLGALLGAESLGGPIGWGAAAFTAIGAVGLAFLHSAKAKHAEQAAKLKAQFDANPSSLDHQDLKMLEGYETGENAEAQRKAKWTIDAAKSSADHQKEVHFTRRQDETSAEFEARKNVEKTKVAAAQAKADAAKAEADKTAADLKRVQDALSGRKVDPKTGLPVGQGQPPGAANAVVQVQGKAEVTTRLQVDLSPDAKKLLAQPPPSQQQIGVNLSRGPFDKPQSNIKK